MELFKTVLIRTWRSDRRLH